MFNFAPELRIEGKFLLESIFMTMKKVMTILLALALVSGAEAQSKFGAQTLLFKKAQQEKMQKQPHRAADLQEQQIGCFIRFNAPCEKELKALGVKPQVVLDGIMTATVPFGALEQVSALEQVTTVDISRKMSLNSDKARQSTQVDKIQQNAPELNLPQHFTGENIVIGVIDQGVDFQHPALRNADGSSRCSLAYFPDRKFESGKGGEAMPYDMPGVMYTKKTDLDTLTTDLPNGSHGTHTTSTAAGRIIDEYGGVAPGAELIVCAVGNNTGQLATLACITTMKAYAAETGKRLIITRSMGTSIGPHDGTSASSEVENKLLEETDIFCQSAGNAGVSDNYIHCTPDLLQTIKIDGVDRKYYALIGSPWDELTSEQNEVSLMSEVWCADNMPFDVGILLYNEKDGLTIYKNKIYKYEENLDKGTFQLGFAQDDYNKMQMTGNVNKSNNKYNLFIRWDLQTNKDKDYYKKATYMGIIIFPREESQEMHIWMDNQLGYLFIDKFVGINPLNIKLTPCNSTLSVNDEASTPNLITVGNYTTKTSFQTLDGKTHTLYSSDNYHKIAKSSSYGTTVNGIVCPTICGPGTTIVAAVSHYDPAYNSDAASSKKMTVNGTDYYWAQMEGTSMSTPHVAGIMALWLQANPNLTRKDILDVLAKTSHPWEGDAADKPRWGMNGRIDALAGLRYILETTDIRDLQVEKELNAKATVYNLSGQLVRSGVAASDAVNGLPSGIYVVNGRKVVIK